MRILNIDAWRDDDGWTWNNWFHVGDFPASLIDKPPRVLIHEMRERGYLSLASRGRIAVEDDGYNLVFKARGTGEPILAIEYGADL